MPGQKALITPPTPAREALEPFHEGLARGELRVARCNGCGRLRFPPRTVCGGCASTEPPEWVGVSGRGRVWSFAVFHKQYLAEGPRVPYNVAVVQLDEGPRLISAVVSDALGDIEVDMPVQAVFEQSNGRPVVKFRLADA
jgi:uncharacterized OB-fold protein